MHYFWRILIAVFFFAVAINLIPMLFTEVGWSLTDNQAKILRLCLAAIGAIYVWHGPWPASRPR